MSRMVPSSCTLRSLQRSFGTGAAAASCAAGSGVAGAVSGAAAAVAAALGWLDVAVASEVPASCPVGSRDE